MSRSTTRTYHASGALPATPPPPVVRDPGLRAILRDVGRALRMIAASIERHTAQAPADEPP
jgi:hypothetical protein